MFPTFSSFSGLQHAAARVIYARSLEARFQRSLHSIRRREELAVRWRGGEGVRVQRIRVETVNCLKKPEQETGPRRVEVKGKARPRDHGQGREGRRPQQQGSRSRYSAVRPWPAWLHNAAPRTVSLTEWGAAPRRPSVLSNKDRWTRRGPSVLTVVVAAAARPSHASAEHENQ